MWRMATRCAGAVRPTLRSRERALAHRSGLSRCATESVASLPYGTGERALTSFATSATTTRKLVPRHPTLLAPNLGTPPASGDPQRTGRFSASDLRGARGTCTARQPRSMRTVSCTSVPTPVNSQARHSQRKASWSAMSRPARRWSYRGRHRSADEENLEGPPPPPERARRSASDGFDGITRYTLPNAAGSLSTGRAFQGAGGSASRALAVELHAPSDIPDTLAHDAELRPEPQLIYPSRPSHRRAKYPQIGGR